MPTFRTKDGSFIRRFEPHERFSTEVPEPPPAPPTLFQKMKNLTRAMKEWQRAGRPVAPKDVRKARQEACNACEYWRPHGNLFLGECTAPGCGCTKAKLFLATSKCPHPGGSKWAA